MVRLCLVVCGAEAADMDPQRLEVGMPIMHCVQPFYLQLPANPRLDFVHDGLQEVFRLLKHWSRLQRWAHHRESLVDQVVSVADDEKLVANGPRLAARDEPRAPCQDPRVLVLPRRVVRLVGRMQPPCRW